ncbi:hypothetical protein ACFL96_19800, partial [Thermoproteota archaeon]
MRNSADIIQFTESLNNQISLQFGTTGMFLPRVRPVQGVYNLGFLRDVVSVYSEMLNINQYSDQVAAFIREDLASDPLAGGEPLNLIGYSGGAQ